MTTNPDDWETHWTLQSDSAARNPAQRFRHRLVAHEVRKAAPRRLIDVGSGQGDFLAMMTNTLPSLELAGIELSSSGVAAARRKVPLADIRQSDLMSPSYSPTDVDFDCLTCIEVLEHLDDPRAFLSIAISHLREGGRALITVPSGPRTAFDVSIGHRDHFSRRRIKSIMREVGLTDIRVKRAGFPFFNLYRLVVLLRGDRLIKDVESSSIDNSKLASAVMRVFHVLMRMNVNYVPLGWQILASGTKGKTDKQS